MEGFWPFLASRGVRVIHVPWSPQSASGPGYDKLTIIDSLKWEKVLQIDQNAVHSWDRMVWSGMVFKISRWVFYGVLVSATVAFHSCRHWGAGSVWDVQLNAANRTIAPRQNPSSMGEQLVVGSYWQIQSCNFSILLKVLGYAWIHWDRSHFIMSCIEQHLRITLADSSAPKFPTPWNWRGQFGSWNSRGGNTSFS
jgi:hypothetical protein